MKYNVLVGEAMKKDVKTVDINDSVEKAARTMKDNKIGSVVAIGEKNIKGIVTATDIVHKYVLDKKGEMVKDVMSTDLVKISPNRSIEEASRLMVAKGVEKLLVFDKERLVGIITATDILRIEPALLEILLERMKVGGRRSREFEFGFAECENCGNYSDDIQEINGVYMCSECRE